MDEMIKALQGLVHFESVAEPEGAEYPYGKEVSRAKDYVLSLAKSMGMKTVDAGSYAYVEIGEGEKLIGMLAHLDVVPAGDGWTKAPFGGEIADDRMYGRGTTDDKGPVIAALYAMKELLEQKKPLQKRIRLILGQTEENGEWEDIEAYLEAEETPDYGFTPDGDFPAIQCEKGAMVFEIKMPLEGSGITSAEGGTAPNMVPGHAVLKTTDGNYEAEGKVCHGCAPWLGVNAISLAATKLTEAEPNSVFGKMYQDLIGETIYGERLGIADEDAESGKLSLNVGTISSDGKDVTLMVDIRYPASSNPSDIEETFCEKFGAYGGVSNCVYQVKPLFIPSDSPVLQALLSSYWKHTGDESAPVIIGGGTYAKAMPGIVAFGPNFPGHENREHMEDEYILLEDFRKLREIYRDALENLLEI
ncbi:MAG: Sapep family Mn(2+)-dependent dipeptidase [Eubacteriales bacterium]|nr:Sapep family Mn(2+)-dependent dipeptidase [Eubacteriales bacterium]